MRKDKFLKGEQRRLKVKRHASQGRDHLKLLDQWLQKANLEQPTHGICAEIAHSMAHVGGRASNHIERGGAQGLNPGVEESKLNVRLANNGKSAWAQHFLLASEGSYSQGIGLG